MNKTLWFIFLFASMAAILAGWYFFCQHERAGEAKFAPQMHHEYVLAEAGHLFGFDLVDPEEAPQEIKESVMKGYYLMMDTQKYAAEYAGDKLNCANCHFQGGDTLGGKNNGISLVGVTEIYPQFSPRNGRIISLADRINNCFERSMNGKPLPAGSVLMEEMIAYLAWISKEVAPIKFFPWLGLPKLKTDHHPNSEAGERVYHLYCALCHRSGGEGDLRQGLVDYPPLWGDGSFNDGAGMSMLPNLASFIYYNMPYGQPFLTEEQALDVASFILTKPRPKFISK